MVKQVRAARTRQALVRAAAEVFADDGYALASLPAISRRAGVSTGALHFHFPSKDLLAREVEAAATASLQRLAARQDTPPGGVSGGPVGAGAGGAGLRLLVEVSRDLVLGLSADPVLRAGFGLGGDPSRKGGEGPGRWWSEWVHALLREAHGAGELAEGVSPEAAAVAVVAATLGLAGLASRHRFHLSPHLVEQFWALLLPGLAAPPPRRPARPGIPAAETGPAPR
ncbi:ScbR family autoregulator-binding transcription factor [Streptomyces sp. NBC_01176]|uniref:ScbR family autoregulator-binding transcription factor n=1 Tax=Streptomyces sp. NBC_01176 TaxID=2903760 RepID=UPI00386CFF54|nr:TetR/AcrR family transcriptional regulator [Streptomyces sp. NBC_01176]WSS89236.1 TetR/AcrR family transcriptional regulator [Streptomyces sp. NBC_01176]